MITQFFHTGLDKFIHSKAYLEGYSVSRLHHKESLTYVLTYVTCCSPLKYTIPYAIIEVHPFDSAQQNATRGTRGVQYTALLDVIGA